MAYAYHKFAGDAEYLRAHCPLLKQFAQYLVDFSLIPAAQLNDYDSTGALVNQSNLVLQGILGLQAMSAIARVAGTTGTRANSRGRWGLHNLYMDKLLNLGIASATLYDTQSVFYVTVSQTYGVPLDSRHEVGLAGVGGATSSTLWPACSTRRPLRGGFGDLFQTTGDGGYTPRQQAFKARPVVGGHFALLALGRSGQGPNATGADTVGSMFPRNGTQALPPPNGGASVPGMPIRQSPSSCPKEWQRKTRRTNKRAVERLDVNGAGTVVWVQTDGRESELGVRCVLCR
ncbi:hypothetical protein DL764_007816 [Monosporascus ibericus]|uniref:Glutaminase A central domain-containing protein n=1 Tax=Monosporascus ibericus TaxID=155417 RepID=A0A4Q4T271_9PEZI|nr:hypothetical protein DL764_007816 [Monosporascus ibericus]